jgi:hypothetical protein
VSLETRLKALIDLIAPDIKALQASSGKEISLPSHAGVRSKQYDPKMAAYNWKQSNTRRLRNALHKAQFGTGACHIVNISDSSSSGFIGGGSAAGYDLLGAWPITMRDILARDLGCSVGGTGIVPAAQWPLSDPDKMMPLGGRWVPSAAGQWLNQGGYSASNGANTYVTFTPEVSGTQADIWYFGNSGQFGVYIDGLYWANPPRSGAMEVQRYTISGLAPGRHTIGIMDNLADGFAVYLAGVMMSDPTKGLHVHNLGIYGEKASGWDTYTDNTLAAVNRQLMVDSLGANIVDCVFIKIGANDLTGGATIDQIKQSIINIRNKPRFAQADVVLVSEPVDPATYPTFAGMWYDLADTLDCPLVDTYQLHGTPAQALADGIITPIDNKHYNARGQKQTGIEVAAPVIDMFATAPVEKTPAQTVLTEVFTANGTWVKPAWANTVEVTCIGAGGAGGSGARDAAGTAVSGGGGGAGGSVTTRVLRASDLGATEPVTVGGATTPGAARTTDTTAGVAGNAGNASSFGSALGGVVTQMVRAGGGSGGSGGGLAVASTGGGGGAGQYNGGSGGTSPNTGGSGTTSSAAIAATGGGGGGGIDTANATKAGGGAGGSQVVSTTASATTAVAGANGAAGVSVPMGAGMGGAGGASHATAPGGAGGAGGSYGGGGGGGAASRNGYASGAGGAGAAGAVIVISRA